MRQYALGIAGLLVLGAVVGVAFGAEAIWVYAFFALFVACTALAAGVGGDLIQSWSRRRFDEPPYRRR
jgi:CDP-diglyceride synthetase